MYEKRFKFSEPKRDTGYIDIPMVLFTDPVLSEISFDAKFMYSILFDILQRRSYDNGWVDDKGFIEWKKCVPGGPDMIYLMDIFAYA